MGKRTEKAWVSRIKNWNRGLRERHSDFRITPEFISKFKSCKYCGKEITPITAGLDHQLPLSRGGNDNPENLILCCQACNRGKSSFTDLEFSGLLAYLDKSWPPEMKRRLISKLKCAWRVQ